jgi:hypothetical protein
VTSLIQAIEASDRCILACGKGGPGHIRWGCTTREGGEWASFLRYRTVEDAIIAFLGRPVSMTQFERDVIYTIEQTLMVGGYFVCEWIGSGLNDGWHRPFACADIVPAVMGSAQN